MFLRRFKGTGPDVVFLVVIITFLVWLRPFLNPDLNSRIVFDGNPMPLFGIIVKIAGQSHFFGIFLTFLMVLLTEFLLVNFNTSQFFISERTFLPALFYGLLSCLVPGQQVLNPALPAAIFLILAIRRIMDSYKIQYTAYSFFDAGLLISTGSLFYINLLWFGFLLIVGILLLRTLNIKEFIISLLGLATPWFIVFGTYYVTGQDVASLATTIKVNLFSQGPGFTLPAISIVLLVIYGIIVLLSIVYLYSVINSKKIKSRKTFRLFSWTFLISAGIYLFIPGVTEEIIWIAGIPVIYFLSHYFVFVRTRLIPEILFLILFVISALIQIW